MYIYIYIQTHTKMMLTGRHSCTHESCASYLRACVRVCVCMVYGIYIYMCVCVCACMYGVCVVCVCVDVWCELCVCDHKPLSVQRRLNTEWKDSDNVPP